MIKVTECGSCGHYHLVPLTGNLWLDDCRNGANRFGLADLDKLFGEDGWIDVTEGWFVNYYRCPDCNEEWEDEWSCQCDDECPACGCRNVSPYKSEDA